MSKVIPADIVKTANDIGLEYIENSEMGLEDALIQAILSERHRCAVIARNWQPSSFKDEQYAANSIADKIMAGER